MKKSEELFKEANEHENDYKSWNLYSKAKRQKKFEMFEENILPILKEKYQVEYSEQFYKFIIDTGNNYGVIDYFAKSNKILIRQTNTWIKVDDLNWLIKNLKLQMSTHIIVPTPKLEITLRSFRIVGSTGEFSDVEARDILDALVSFRGNYKLIISITEI